MYILFQKKTNKTARTIYTSERTVIVKIDARGLVVRLVEQPRLQSLVDGHVAVEAALVAARSAAAITSAATTALTVTTLRISAAASVAAATRITSAAAAVRPARIDRGRRSTTATGRRVASATALRVTGFAAISIVTATAPSTTATSLGIRRIAARASSKIIVCFVKVVAGTTALRFPQMRWHILAACAHII